MVIRIITNFTIALEIKSMCSFCQPLPRLVLLQKSLYITYCWKNYSAFKTLSNTPVLFTQLLALFPQIYIGIVVKVTAIVVPPIT